MSTPTTTRSRPAVADQRDRSLGEASNTAFPSTVHPEREPAREFVVAGRDEIEDRSDVLLPSRRIVEMLPRVEPAQ
jgi:hypothetical protein